MIRSTMSDFPLTINTVLRHGRRVHAGSECVTFTGDGVRRATYRQVADNADRLAAALRRLGIGQGDPVGTFMWNDLAKWQVPENWAFVDGIPKTSVGKFDKKALRTLYETGELAPSRV
jgi:acyl-CoA synthetase (AMP-forming)/AMP-acid ligase II